jgi:hypothetical protein
LYEVLLNRKIILPFQSTLKNKEWAALPFEDGGGIKPTALYRLRPAPTARGAPQRA